MKLYLVRHASALDEIIDPARPLSPKGKKQARATGRFLRYLGANPGEVWCSEKLRAEQTARAILKALKRDEGPLIRKGLAPTDPVKDLYEELQHRDGELVIVGHAPFLPRLAALLLDTLEIGFHFDTGGVARIERMEPENWVLTLLVSPSELKKKDK